MWEYFYFVKIFFRYYWLMIAVHNSKSFTLISGPSLMCWKCRKFVHKLAKFSGAKLDAQKCNLRVFEHMLPVEVSDTACPNVYFEFKYSKLEVYCPWHILQMAHDATLNIFFILKQPKKDTKRRTPSKYPVELYQKQQASKKYNCKYFLVFTEWILL